MNAMDTAGLMQMPLEQTETKWVREVLEPDQLSTAKMNYGLRKLNRGTIILLWGLRVYAVLMVLIIALEIRNALHGGA